MSDTGLQNSNFISIKGAREHNLKNVNVQIPRGQFTVITGVSGSGKSSLAFDTIYAEGYRKYIDSLSTKARMVLEQIPRPDLDFIEGLSPVIALQQRTGGGGNNPRSTVATVTEIADFSRVLWTVCGKAYCPKDGGLIERRSMDDCLNRVFAEPEESRLMVLAPWMKAKPALLREELPRLQQRGFQRVRIDGVIRRLDEADLIESKAVEISVDIVVDRIVLRSDQRSRLADSIELAFSEGQDRALILVESSQGEWRELPLSNRLSCVQCGTVFDRVTPKHFSWNHAEGACELCGGLGETLQFQAELIVPDVTKSAKNGAIKPWRLGSKQMIIRRNAILKQLAEQLPFDADCAWEDLEPSVRKTILFGGGDRLFSFKLKRGHSKPEATRFEGVVADLEATRLGTSSEGLRARLMAYQTSSRCESCHGKRLRKESLHVLIDGKSISDFLQMPLIEANAFIDRLSADHAEYGKVSDAIRGLGTRLSFLNEVGLTYLTLDRPYTSLSGGEAQRVRLATQLGMSLVGVVYLLDEPSIGLHPLDNRRLISTLIGLRDRGNTVVVVEHDAETMKAANYLIEIGPGAGTEGGEIIFEGLPEASFEDSKSRSGPFLSGAVSIAKSAQTLSLKSERIIIHQALENNLKQIDVTIPVGLLTVVCGISGSGKSTLINDILAKAAALRLNRAKAIPGKYGEITGLDNFSSVIQVDQSPIGRSPRSNPATFTKLFDQLRDLFSKCSLAKVRGYKSSRFSFNIAGGRCERCKGDGAIKLDMQFMADVYTDCPSCLGQRYNRETLDVRFKGFSIADILSMSVDEALAVFSKQPRIAEKLRTLADVGLGYVKLGQPATTLSGGEAQRIKLSLELSKRQQGETLYILDEPTTGLHWVDVQRLVDLVFKLRDAGNTIIIIEHDLDVIRMADWVIELGPEGGAGGGRLLFEGSGADFFVGKDTPTQQAF